MPFFSCSPAFIQSVVFVVKNQSNLNSIVDSLSLLRLQGLRPRKLIAGQEKLKIKQRLVSNGISNNGYCCQSRIYPKILKKVDYGLMDNKKQKGFM